MHGRKNIELLQTLLITPQYYTEVNVIMKLFNVKVKIKVQLALEQATKAQRYCSTLSLTSAVDGGCGQRHTLAALHPRKRSDVHCTGGWVGPRVSLDGRRKSGLLRDSIPGTVANNEFINLSSHLFTPTKLFE
jgi:hypothetical protein